MKALHILYFTHRAAFFQDPRLVYLYATITMGDEPRILSSTASARKLISHQYKNRLSNDSFFPMQDNVKDSQTSA